MSALTSPAPSLTSPAPSAAVNPSFELAPGPSLIANAGLGLHVVSGTVPRGGVACVYAGTKLTTKEVFAQRRAESSSPDAARGGGYMMRLGFVEGDGIIWVDAENSSALARYINDPVSPLAYNVRFEKDPASGTADVVALRDIVQGEELFVDYGKAYWRGLKPERLKADKLGER